MAKSSGGTRTGGRLNSTQRAVRAGARQANTEAQQRGRRLAANRRARGISPQRARQLGL